MFTVEFPQTTSLKNNTFLITKDISHNICYKFHADNFFLGDVDVLPFHSLPLKIRFKNEELSSIPCDNL